MTERKDKKNKLEADLEEFVDAHFSHNSAKEFLVFRRESVDNYETIHLSVAYVDAKTEDEKIHQTELKLAQKALERGCKYVTNIDYCGPCIAATGLRRKLR